MKRFLWIGALLLWGLSACSRALPADAPTLSVSIEPLRYLTEQITGNDFEINVLVPPGSGPETYEPSPAQMRRIARSSLFIYVGLLDFEKNMSASIAANMPEVGLVPLAEGISLIEGEDEEGSGHEDHEGHGHHHHGVDPHIWSSPGCLKIMAGNLYAALEECYPDSLRYRRNYEALLEKLDSLDRTLAARFAAGPTRFMIYHPALGYLAREYGLTQIALENEGKEPSADHIRRLIDTARRYRIPRILYQQQFSRTTVDALARELGIEAVPIDPLGYDIEYNLIEISNLITNP